MTMLELAERLQAYDPLQSSDNRADEAQLHDDIVMATGIGSLAHRYERTFVRSLDEAMTLVPDGFDWIIGRTNDGLTIHAEVGGRGGEFMRFGNTPALALCAAALRARAKIDGAA